MNYNFQEIIRIFLADGLIPEYATAVARVMHVKPLCPVRTYVMITLFGF